MTVDLGSTYPQVLNALAEEIHTIDCSRWWHDLHTGERLQRNTGELLCLIHSEISEAMEGDRKDLMDDKLPHRKMMEVELADAIIRILDLAGSQEMDIGGAIQEKRAYNATRRDSTVEGRLEANGKRY